MRWNGRSRYSLSLGPLVLESLFFLALFKMLILLKAKDSLKVRFGIFQSETINSLSAAEDKIVKSITRVIRRVSKIVPWQNLCLDKAITGQYMLQKRGISSTLYLGMIKNEHQSWTAHAWLRSGSVWVTGFNPHVEYTVVATYAKIPRQSKLRSNIH